MSSVRKMLALWAAKVARVALHLLKRNGTQLPGHIALKICPTIIANLAKPAKIAVVTGTNGKTTVVNLLVDALQGEGTIPLSNRFGSNTTPGVVSALIEGVSCLGKSKFDTAILEMDERSARLILPDLDPDVLVCTNLTRDSVKRNAHPEYIAWIISSAIPAKTTLVLNADDLICAGIGSQDNERILFSIDQLPSDTTQPTGVARDVAICPKCDTLLVWDYWRFNHIGHAHCPNCGFESPHGDYRVTSVDVEGNLLAADMDGESMSCRLLNDNVVNIYNQIAVMATLDHLGMPREKIGKAFDHLQPPSTRFDVRQIGRVALVRQLTKGLVGVACSRAFQYIMAMPGKKSIVMNIDEVTDAKDDCEDTCWIYDADYEYLATDSLVEIMVGGVRRHDQALRLAVAGVDPGKIRVTPGEHETADLVTLTGIDQVCNLHSVHNSISTGNVVEATLTGRLQAMIDGSAPAAQEVRP